MISTKSFKMWHMFCISRRFFLQDRLFLGSTFARFVRNIRNINNVLVLLDVRKISIIGSLGVFEKMESIIRCTPLREVGSEECDLGDEGIVLEGQVNGTEVTGEAGVQRVAFDGLTQLNPLFSIVLVQVAVDEHARDVD